MSVQSALGEAEYSGPRPDTIASLREVAQVRAELRDLETQPGIEAMEDRAKLQAHLDEVRKPNGGLKTFKDRMKADRDRAGQQLRTVLKSLVEMEETRPLAEHLRRHVSIGTECMYRSTPRSIRPRMPQPEAGAP